MIRTTSVGTVTYLDARDADTSEQFGWGVVYDDETARLAVEVYDLAPLPEHPPRLLDTVEIDLWPHGVGARDDLPTLDRPVVPDDPHRRCRAEAPDPVARVAAAVGA